MPSWHPLAHVRSRQRPVEPVPTGLAPRLAPLPGVRAVLFDLYGTLLVSSAGDTGEPRRTRGVAAMASLLPRLPATERTDPPPPQTRISHAPSSRDAARTRPREARPGLPAGLYENLLSKGNPGRNEAGAGRRSRSEAETACSQSSPQGAEGGNSQQKGDEKCGLAEAARLLDRFEAILARRQAEARADGEPHPEIDIREVWSELLGNRATPLHPLAEELALRFECEANPCCEMPGAAAILRRLRAAGMPLGVVSNAQAYTASVFEAATGLSLSHGPFDDDLSLYSWREGRGKPSPALFQHAAEALARRGIAPREALFVGNDLVKDVLPAAAVGLRTALYAGDARSLRCGDLPPDEAARRADLVLTRLDQLAEALPQVS